LLKSIPKCIELNSELILVWVMVWVHTRDPNQNILFLGGKSLVRGWHSGVISLETLVGNLKKIIFGRNLLRNERYYGSIGNGYFSREYGKIGNWKFMVPGLN